MASFIARPKNSLKRFSRPRIRPVRTEAGSDLALTASPTSQDRGLVSHVRSKTPSRTRPHRSSWCLPRPPPGRAKRPCPVSRAKSRLASPGGGEVPISGNRT
jgi:hypothetical protein